MASEKASFDGNPPASKSTDGQGSTGDVAERVNTTWEDDVSSVDVEMERSITRKFDRHLLPWLFGLWLLAFIDRSNIGNARIVGLEDDLGLEENKFNIALAIFYIPYVVVDVPSNLILKRLRAGYYLPFLVASWGLVSLCIGFVKDYAGLLVTRFFLGLCEGGLLGGIIIYLAMFYRRHQLLYRIGLFYCAAPLSGAIGGLLATGFSQIQTAGYNGWPFIFFIEGAITIVFAVIAAFFLPHTPGDAKFLSSEENAVATKRMQEDASGAATQSDVRQEKFQWSHLRMAVLNINTILLSINFFAIITPIYSYSLFLPTIVESLGYTDMAIINLLTVPPNALAFITVLVIAHISDRTHLRGPFMILGCVSAIIGYAMLLGSDIVGVRYAGTFFIAAGIFPASPLVMGWLANNVAPHYVRATATGFQIGVANLAAFIATFTYLEEDAPDYVTGHSLNIGMLVFAVCITTLTILYNRRENSLRDAGKRDHRLEDDDPNGQELGHLHPKFRYTL